MSDDKLRHWLAEIRVDGSEYATGIPIASEHVLTTAHVLRTRGGRSEPRIQVRFPRHAPDKWHDARVSWDGMGGTRQYDVLVLELQDPPVFETVAVLTRRPPSIHDPWWAEAYPEAGFDDHAVNGGANAVPIRGSVVASAMPGELLHLDVAHDAPNRADWKGASGCPIFVNSTVIGVLVSFANKLDNRFHAVPTADLLSEPRFVKLVAPAADDSYLKHASERATALLDRAPAAKHALARQLEALQARGETKARISSEISAEELVDASLDLSLGAWLRAVNDAHYALATSGDQAGATTLFRLVNWLLPALKDVRFMSISTTDVGLLMRSTLPARTATLAEILVASRHAVPAHFRPLPEAGTPVGPGSLQGGMEQGFSRTKKPEAVAKNRATPASRKFEDIRRHLLALIDAQTRSRARGREQEDRAIRNYLAIMKRSVADPIVYYYLSEGEDSDSREVATNLLSTFPELFVADLAAGDVPFEEQELIVLLIDFLTHQWSCEHGNPMA